MIRARLNPRGPRMPAPTRLPGPEQHAAHAWAGGYWFGIAVGLLIGVCTGCVLARAGVF